MLDRLDVITQRRTLTFHLRVLDIVLDLGVKDISALFAQMNMHFRGLFICYCVELDELEDFASVHIDGL